jgi:hypothetical protein
MHFLGGCHQPGTQAHSCTEAQQWDTLGFTVLWSLEDAW